MSNDEYLTVLLNRIVLTDTYILRKLCKNSKEYERYQEDINKVLEQIKNMSKESDNNDDGKQRTNIQGL